MNKKMNLKIANKKEQMVENLNLPKDLMLGASIVTIIGSQEVCVENYKGILEYTKESIIIQGKNCQICFGGKKLSIDYYTNEDMKISGCLDSVRYVK